jgi:outer membrane protein assembly factor BamE
MQKQTRMTAAIVAITLLGATQGACSLFGVYKIDIPQGSPLTQAQVAQVKVGMTTQQVRYILGTPPITDTLNANRWDYIYTYVPGTVAREAGLKTVSGQHAVILFDANDQVTSINGGASFPVSQPGLPTDKEANPDVQ